MERSEDFGSTAWPDSPRRNEEAAEQRSIETSVRWQSQSGWTMDREADGRSVCNRNGHAGSLIEILEEKVIEQILTHTNFSS